MGPALKSPVTRAVALGLAVTLASCGTSGMYAWGHYEDSVYRMTSDEGDFELEAEIEVLQEDLAKARERGERVPPGFHAHLGYLMYLAGDVENARGNMLSEKELFPESAVFVDRTLARMGW